MLFSYLSYYVIFLSSYILKVVGNTTAKTKLDVPELVKKVQENSKKDIEGNGWQDAADRCV